MGPNGIIGPDLIRMRTFRVFLSSARNMQILNLKIHTWFYFLAKLTGPTFFRQFLGLIVDGLL